MLSSNGARLAQPPTAVACGESDGTNSPGVEERWAHNRRAAMPADSIRVYHMASLTRFGLLREILRESTSPECR